MIPYGKQNISEEDIQSVIDVLKSDLLTQGPAVPIFEKSVANYCRASHAVAVNSATSALHIACLALGLGEGDWLWTSPITFVASANCGIYCGAQVDFVDIDPRTYNLCPLTLEKKLIQAEKQGKLPKVLVPVHLTGQPCEMSQIYTLSQKYGFYVIEDASHAIGGRYQGQPIGNCAFSDVTIFSFHPVKIITTGEGGIALTNNKKLAEKMVLYRSHGITRDPELMTKEPDGEWYYQQVLLGYNYRMTDLQAALGVNQMKRLDEFVLRRHQLANRFDEILKDLPVVTPHQGPDGYSAFHLYVIRLDLEKAKNSHKAVFEGLRQAGIGVNLHYIPVHTQPYYQEIGFQIGDFPEAERYYQEAISLPLFFDLTFKEQDQVIDALRLLL